MHAAPMSAPPPLADACTQYPLHAGPRAMHTVSGTAQIAVVDAPAGARPQIACQSVGIGRPGAAIHVPFSD